MFLSYSLGLFSVLSLLSFLFFYSIHSGENSAKTEKIINSERYLLNLTAKSLSGRVGQAVSDVLYLADRISAADDALQDLDLLSRDMVFFANRKRMYNHFSLLNIKGQELIRINYNTAGSYANDESSLIKTSETRSFFSQTMTLKKGCVFISRLGLLQEKEDLINLLQPEIIVSAPVYREGKPQGVIAASYSAQYMLDEFSDIAGSSEGSMFLLNTAGYYLVNAEDKQKEFAFLHDDAKNARFQAQRPVAWAQVHKAASGSFQTPEGVFVYTWITPYNGFQENSTSLSDTSYRLEEGSWYAVSFLSRAMLDQLSITPTFLSMASYIFSTQWPTFLGIFLASVAIGVLLSYNKISKDKVRYFSEYDAMTGVFNRRAGVALLEKNYREATREQQKLSICFLDIDGLKQVNDQLGHDIGDHLIKDVTDIIKKCIRQQDFVIRLGGDEFLIAFLKADINQAELAWQRIREEYQRINTAEERSYVISVSHGIAELDPNFKCMVDEALSVADEKMYAEKRLVKMGLNVIRD